VRPLLEEVEVSVSTWTRTELTTTKVVYAVQLYDGRAAWNQVEQALSAAHGEARRINGGNPISDDTVWVSPGVNEILIWFEKQSEK
jgi:hypothetical protein